MKILNAYKEAFHSKHRYIVMRGGAGSGKSVFATQKIIARILNEQGHKFLVLRKVGSTIKNSVFALFKQIIISENLQDLFIINKSDFTITCKINNNQIIFSGLDDAEKIKSIAGITGAWCEEATEFTLEEWNQIQLRIRGQHKNYVQFMLTFNPISETHWLKAEFWDKDDDDVLKLVTTYKPHLPLHISVDFNVLPHCSMGIFQIENGNIYMVDEIALEHPRNLTKDMALEFKRKYSTHVGGLFIYGDVAGRHSDTRSEAGHNDYSILMLHLAQFKPQLRVGIKAPSIAMSTNFLNGILEGDELIKLSFEVSPECKKMIADLSYLKQNAEGGKLIEYEKHPVTGTKYEKYGHFYDLLRYFLTSAFAREYQIFQTGSKPFSNVTFGKRPAVRSGY